MIKYIVILLSLFFLIGCNATPNLKIASESIQDHNFNKKEKIFVILMENPTEAERKYDSYIKNALTNEGFNLVDSLNKAECLITYRISEGVTWNNNTSMGQQVAGEFGDMQSYGGTTISTVDSGHTVLGIEMYQVDNLDIKNRKLIWNAFISTHTENFELHPQFVAKLILKEYGKNKVYSKRFPKPY